MIFCKDASKRLGRPRNSHPSLHREYHPEAVLPTWAKGLEVKVFLPLNPIESFQGLPQSLVPLLRPRRHINMEKAFLVLQSRLLILNLAAFQDVNWPLSGRFEGRHL